MTAPPDFAQLVAEAYPETGAGSDAALRALWGALFDLPEWFMLVRPARIASGEEPFPYIANVGGSGWVMVFTSKPQAQRFAADHDLLGPDGEAFVLSLDPTTVRRWMRRLVPPSVTHVRFDEGPHGWFAPPQQIEVIAAYLGRALAG